MIVQDALRPGFCIDRSASNYKDWLHLAFADPETDTVGLINVSLHGSPSDERSRVMGAVLVHSPEWGWKSHVEIRTYAEAYLGTGVIGLRDIALATDDRNGTIHASSRGSLNPFHARFLAGPVTAAINLKEKIPFGDGWLSWFLVPSMRLSGEWVVDGRRRVLTNAPAYHDRNWGHWHWGDDFGWEWGCFLRCPADPHSPTLVFGRTTNRAHTRHGQAFLVADSGAARRYFAAEEIEVRFDGQLDVPLRRIPGAMAALHQNMAEPWLPHRVEIRAKHGSDCVTISFVARAAAQVVTADPEVHGYGFIHEMAGEYVGRGSLRGIPFENHGYAIFEYLN